MRTFKAYLVTNTVTGLKYVGITVRYISDRWIQHCKDSRQGHNQPLQAAIRKYGRGAFLIQHVASMTSLEAAYEVEELLIKQFGTHVPHGYNDLSHSNIIPVLPANCACERCGRTFRQKPSRIAANRGRFCSWTCRWAKSLSEKFWSKVKKTDGCWLWQGATCGSGEFEGYGRIFITVSRGKRITILAHRLSYELNRGPIPEGLHIDHLCRVTTCVNPDHLEPVTCAVNNARGISPAANNTRKTHCKNGHPFSGDNLRPRIAASGNSARECHACRLAITKRYHQRQKQRRQAA